MTTINSYSDNIRLREITDDDFEFLYELENDPMVTRFSHGGPKDEKCIEALICNVKRSYQNKGYALWIFELIETKEPIGYVGVFDSSLENNIKFETFLHWAVSLEHRNSGYSTEAVIMVIDHFFKNFDCDEIFVTIDKNNKPSKALAEKIGFNLVGSAVSEVLLKDLGYSEKEPGMLIYILYREEITDGILDRVA